MPLVMLLGESFNIETEQANNGLVAVQKFKNDFFKTCCNDNHFKLILMDIQMPTMNGIDAAKEIIKVLKENNRED